MRKILVSFTHIIIYTTHNITNSQAQNQSAFTSTNTYDQSNSTFTNTNLQAQYQSTNANINPYDQSNSTSTDTNPQAQYQLAFASSTLMSSLIQLLQTLILRPNLVQHQKQAHC